MRGARRQALACLKGCEEGSERSERDEGLWRGRSQTRARPQEEDRRCAPEEVSSRAAVGDAEEAGAACPEPAPSARADLMSSVCKGFAKNAERACQGEVFGMIMVIAHTAVFLLQIEQERQQEQARWAAYEAELIDFYVSTQPSMKLHHSPARTRAPLQSIRMFSIWGTHGSGASEDLPW